MAQTLGSIDLASLKNLRDDVTQYFWFESNSSSAWGSGAHVTLYPESQFTNPSHANYMKGQNIIMNTDGISIRNGLLPMMVLDNGSLDFNAVDTSLGTYTTMATFGLTGATIGQTSGAHSVIDANGQRFYATDGTTQLANIGYGEGVNALGGTSVAPYYTFGIRNSTTVGNYSVAEGLYTIASGYCSYAEGYFSIADGSMAHAEGNRTYAYGYCSHAEGIDSVAGVESSPQEGRYSHAEGESTYAEGKAAHSEGGGAEADGDYSHAQNRGTIAKRLSQTVIGEFNKADTYGADGTERGNYSFIIGNGTADNARSNALTVDWQGNVVAGGDVTDGTGNLLPFIAKKDVTTYDEITTALGAGKIVFAVDGNLTYTYSTKASGDYIFTRVRNYSTSSAVGVAYLRVGSSNVWTTTNSGVVRYAGGTASFSNIATNSYQDATISFGETFGSTPHVTACLSTTGTAGNIGNVSVSVHTITTTGCKIRVFNNRGSSLSPNVEWIAIGT